MPLIDQYSYFNRFSHIHPVEKISLIMLMLIFSLIAREFEISLAVFIISSAMIFFAGIPAKFYGKLLMIPFAFIFLSLIPITINITRGDILLEDSIWRFSLGGHFSVFIDTLSIETAITLLFISTGSVSCLYLLILTTPLVEILYVLKRWRVSPILIEMIALTYRFLFVLKENATVIHLSQASRLGYSSYWKSIFSLGSLISALFLKSFQKAKRLNQASESRGGYGEVVGSGQIYTFSIVNWLFMAIVLALLIILFFL